MCVSKKLRMKKINSSGFSFQEQLRSPPIQVSVCVCVFKRGKEIWASTGKPQAWISNDNFPWISEIRGLLPHSFQFVQLTHAQLCTLMFTDDKWEADIAPAWGMRKSQRCALVLPRWCSHSHGSLIGHVAEPELPQMQCLANSLQISEILTDKCAYYVQGARESQTH